MDSSIDILDDDIPPLALILCEAVTEPDKLTSIPFNVVFFDF